MCCLQVFYNYPRVGETSVEECDGSARTSAPDTSHQPLPEDNLPQQRCGTLDS